MKSIDELWKTRLNHHIHETRSYLRYMLNDHLLFVFIFLAAGGALAYQDWLDTLSPDFPGILIMTVALAFLLITVQVRTLLKEADKVFLLPMEHKLRKYFQQAFSYSFIIQIFILLVAMILFLPLYNKVAVIDGAKFLLTLFLLILVNYWNLRISWKISFLTDNAAKWSDLLVRLAINACVVFFILSQKYIFTIVLFLIMTGYDVYFSRLVKSKAVKWSWLISKEEEKKQSFYKLANLFTDVPKLKKRAKRRQYLDWILRQIPYRQENVYQYLYTRAFLRSGGYLGVVIRLTIIGAIILSFIQVQLAGSVIVSILFLFLTGIQIMSLHKHYELFELTTLYPTAENTKLASFLKVLFNVLSFQAIIYAVVTLISATLITFFVMALASALFVSLFVLVYMRSRLIKSEKEVH